MPNFEYHYGWEKKSQQVLYLRLHLAIFSKDNFDMLKCEKFSARDLDPSQYS